MLLALWGQDLVQRQQTNTKRTKEVYEKISEKFNQNGFERTADQVRTRVFNMIAEYRRILKDPNVERIKKCIFFEALHRIYQAKHMDDVKSALDDYEPEYPYSPVSNAAISSEKGDESVSDSEATDSNETLNNSTAANTSLNVASSNNNNSSSSGAAGASGQGSSTPGGANSTGTANTTSYNNNGDSNNSNKDKDSSATAGPTPNPLSKRIKLQDPQIYGLPPLKNSSTSSASSVASHETTSSSNTTTGSSKQAKTQQLPAVATVGGSSTASASSSSSSSTHNKQQSLLMPHASTSASASGANQANTNNNNSSTPVGKLTAAKGACANTPSYININSTKLPIIRTNQLIGHSNGNDSINLNGTTATRLPTTAAITSHQLYQAPVNTFDVTSSALLIDRMFAHLSRESENMREWIALEKERLALERARRQQDTEREVRRERVLIDTLMRFQEQWLSFLSRLDPKIMENTQELPPELRIPPKETTSSTLADASQNPSASSQPTTGTTTTSSSNNPTSDGGNK